MLLPKKQKFKKYQKGRVSSKTKSGDVVAFGEFGLKSLDQLRIGAKQIEAARKAAVRKMKRQGKFWIRIFPDVPVSKKPNEVRMGKGKGNIEYYAARISPGRVLFEVDGVSEDVAVQALKVAGAKLSVRTKLVKRYYG
ncbi:50S ribosomal protein L16 [Rickettsia endosymbiont of Cardiosporidium cionae]|uniref:50S ribosomal protein L16 n=1 Tax=Rickettsia endosymbiont of Cardiosporidium cionae TaxID=2777155 RepID=UPI00189451B3|nr:50S ribosomal protein L16 [Rickettsia endosymbiont of Cardiosporidium cionae]KAF8818195.1 50S ribosomal protein L16 [Rickettsia endosymbiont of Cardiosporidium cionae]